MREKLFIIGAGATANNALQFVREYGLFDVAGFAVDAQYKGADTFLGLPLYSIDELDKVVNKREDLLFVAIAWNRLNRDRKEAYERLKAMGYRFANLISPTARVSGRIGGDNCWLNDYATIHNNAAIGANTVLWCYAYVAHDCTVGAHSFFALRASMAGMSHVGEGCFLGINSAVHDGVTVGNRCVIGANVSVEHSIPDFSVCKAARDSIVIQQFKEKTIELLMTADIRNG